MKIDKIDINNPPERIIATIRNTNYRDRFKLNNKLLLAYTLDTRINKVCDRVDDKLDALTRMFNILSELEDIEITEKKEDPIEGHPYIVTYNTYDNSPYRRHYAGTINGKHYVWNNGYSRYTIHDDRYGELPRDIDLCTEINTWKEIPEYPYPK